MSKLGIDKKFIDVSDYGRPIARVCANLLKDTSATPVQMTLLFGVCGIIATWAIIAGHFFTAAILLVLKSIIDALDGELARVKNTPSYTGRYLDSIFDSILNFIFLAALWYTMDNSFVFLVLAFISIQLQCSLYNYYYVILRSITAGSDVTSKIFETETPTAFPGEKQTTVNILYSIFNFLYVGFDKTVQYLDSGAYRSKHFPKWFMTMVSFYGLGFQLLIISIMLVVGWGQFVIPFFIFYSVFIFIFIIIRKYVLRTE